MTEFHRLTPAQLADLASGTHSPSVLRALRAGQLSRHLLLLRHLADTVPGHEAVAVIDAARARNPEAASEVLTDPMVSAWLADEVRRLSGRDSAGADPAQLAGLAAAMAFRTGLEADMTTRVRGRAVIVPTLGLLTGTGEDDRPIGLRVRDRRLTITDGAHTIEPEVPGGRWLGLRRLPWETAPDGTVALDDTNPYRVIFKDQPQERLHDDDVVRWQSLFAETGFLLSRRAGDRMAELGGVLRTVIPLTVIERDISQSVTARYAFGAVAATMPTSPSILAATLVHEAQHSKANAFLQLETLFDPNDPKRYFAPWRKDPRPIWGLFHGVYAFLAVAELMNLIRAEPTAESESEKSLAKIRLQLRVALEALANATSLTESGRRFVGGLQDRLTRLDAVVVSRATLHSAGRMFDQGRADWQRRNGRTH